MLCGEPGESLGPKVDELVDRVRGLREPSLQRGDLALQPCDLGVAWVWAFAGLLEGLKALFEFGAEVGVGAVAVEGSAVDAGLGGESLDASSG